MANTLIPFRLGQGGVGAVVCDKRVLLLLERRRRAAALSELTSQLAELLGVGQRLQHRVLALQNRVPLIQLLDVLFQHLHLLANSIHQVALNQVLEERLRETIY